MDIFTRLEQKKQLIESLKYCQEKKGLEVYAYVVMPSHLHIICKAKEGYELANIMRDFKKFTSREILKQIKEGKEGRREWLNEMFAKACAHLKRDQKFKV